jgi:hypothetical protein
MVTAVLIALLSGVMAAPAPPGSARPKASRAAPSASRAAPGVQLTIRDGKVWLKADRVTAAEILEAWAQVGGTSVVNGERVPGGPMILELNGVPEQEALEVVLRSASGFLAVARTATVADIPPPAPSTASRFARIVVLPASAPPAESALRAAVTAPAAAPSVPQFPLQGEPAAQRIIGPDGLPVPDDQEDAPPPPASMPPGFSTPPQAPPAEAVPVTPNAVPAPPPSEIAAPPPGATPAPPPGATPAPPPGTTPAPPPGVSAPGMIVPLPPPLPAIPVPVRPRPGGRN